MRAGLFGGTFNPIHNGHLMVAQKVLARFALECLYVIPCRTPPHKQPVYLAPAADRLRMIQLALPDDPRLHLSEIEIQRNGASYTIDTVHAFAAQITPGADLFLIMGMDAFFDIHTWKHSRSLLEAVRPLVVTRRGDTDEKGVGPIEQMDRYIQSRLSTDYRLSAEENVWQTPAGQAIYLLETQPLSVSSTMVRDRIRAGKGLTGLVPPLVDAYIEQKELYR
ncbi:NadD: predicted nicotinate-nucleotide adenylyltransferase [Desulfosarcina variabilis str. Montpellier]|uniref:nicotinate-nucleotide adenylyltransferase n=1 Tax=Desulfosarcina variabilis TaxID=2300 RepID=UPI003AFB37AD